MTSMSPRNGSGIGHDWVAAVCKSIYEAELRAAYEQLIRDARKVACLIFACKTEKAKLEGRPSLEAGRADAGTDMSTYVAENPHSRARSQREAGHVPLADADIPACRETTG
jgi:hypothetical protein